MLRQLFRVVVVGLIAGLGRAEVGGPAAENPEAGEPPATAADPAPARPPEDDGPRPVAGRQPAEVLGRLGHDDFQVRKQAQEELLAWGRKDPAPRIGLLYDAYRDSDNPEVRLRTREVLKQLVIEQQPWEGQGYLGIQMQAAQIGAGAGEALTAVLVTEVREGTAAAEAGVRPGDLIHAVDGLRFKEVDPRLSFGDYIRSKKPGEFVELAIRRDDEELKIKSGLRRRSPLLDRLTPWGRTFDLPDQAELDEADFREWLSRKEDPPRNNKNQP